MFRQATSGVAYTGLPPAIVYTDFAAYSAQYPISFSTQSTLPAGISVNARSGALQGTTTATGTYSVVVLAVGQSFRTETPRQTFVVNPPFSATRGDVPLTVILSVTAPVNMRGISPNGGSGDYTFGSVGLPVGLKLSAKAGSISGSPRTSGNYSTTLFVTDSNNIRADVQVVFSIFNAPRIKEELVDVTKDAEFTRTVLEIEGGVAPYFFGWDTNPSLLPVGVDLNPYTGQLFGTPISTARVYPGLILTATDSLGVTVRQSVVFAVHPPLIVTADASGDPSATLLSAYSGPIVSVSGGFPPYEHRLTAPTGLAVKTLDPVDGKARFQVVGTIVDSFPRNSSTLVNITLHIEDQNEAVQVRTCVV